WALAMSVSPPREKGCLWSACQPSVSVSPQSSHWPPATRSRAAFSLREKVRRTSRCFPLGQVGVHCAALDDVRAARAVEFLCFQVAAGDGCEDRSLGYPSLGCDLCRREGVCVIGHDMKVADDAQ